MKPASLLRALVPLVPLVLLAPACGPSGEQAANVVQAASKAAAETGQQLAEKAAELARATPEQARAKLQEFVDAAGRELEEAKDSATVQAAAADVQAALQRLGELKSSLAPKLNLASLQTKVADLIQKFKDDPRVVAALKAVQEAIEALTR